VTGLDDPAAGAPAGTQLVGDLLAAAANVRSEAVLADHL